MTAPSYMSDLYNTLNTHIDMGGSGFKNAAEFESFVGDQDKQGRDRILKSVWSQLETFDETNQYKSFSKFRNQIDLNYAPGYGQSSIPDRYEQFENVAPEKGYIINTGDGYRYIKKGTIEISSSWDNFYDTQAITDKNGNTYPILNISDYWGSRIMGDTRKWLADEGYQDNKNIVGFTSEEDKKRVGMTISEELLEYGGGIDLLQETRNRNSIFYDEYDISDEGAESIALQGSNVMHEFAMGFGPFRHAINKSMFELSSEENMRPLADDYKRVYNKLIKEGHDIDYSQSLALKTVFMPAFDKKLAQEEVRIPEWFDGAMANSWLNYNLGITVPELNREALMFHNDGFKRIIDAFQEYTEEGSYTPLRTMVPWELQITPEDYADPQVYSQKMGSFINAQLNKLSKGFAPKDKDSYDTQKQLVSSILMQDMMNQTRIYGDAVPRVIPPAAFWLIGNKNSPRFFKALKSPELRAWLPHGFKYRTDIAKTTIDDILKLPKHSQKAFIEVMKHSNKTVFNNLLDLNSDHFAFTKYTDRNIAFNPKRAYSDFVPKRGPLAGSKLPVSKTFWMYKAGTTGLDLTMDIIQGALSGFGDNWSPRTKSGKDFFDALDVWEADPGERNWFSIEGDYEMAWLLEDELLGVGSMFGYDTFSRNAQDYSNIHSTAQKIFDGIGTAITDGYNRGLSTKTTLSHMGAKFHSDITSSEGYKALTTKEEKDAFYLSEFYKKTFDRSPTPNLTPGEKGQVKNGLYQDVLRNYIEAYNSYEGGLSMINRLRVGNDTNKMVVRDVPPPPNFPPELWNDMINIAKMSDEEYIEAYPEGFGIEEEIIRPGSKPRPKYVYDRDKKTYVKQPMPVIDKKYKRNTRLGGTHEFSSEGTVHNYNIHNGLYESIYDRADEPRTRVEELSKYWYKNQANYGPHPSYSNNSRHNNFDYNIFQKINTTFDTVYDNRVLQDVNELIDDWIENVTQTKKSIDRIKEQRDINNSVEYREYLQREGERNDLRAIMADPVSTRVDISNFVSQSQYLDESPYGKVIEDLDLFDIKLDVVKKIKKELKEDKPLFDFEAPF